MTHGPPGKRERPARQPGALKVFAGTEAESTASADIPAHRPWARRDDAHDVEVRYRRSVHYWLRRPMCVHGRRADECTS